MQSIEGRNTSNRRKIRRLRGIRDELTFHNTAGLEREQSSVLARDSGTTFSPQSPLTFFPCGSQGREPHQAEAIAQVTRRASPLHAGNSYAK